jgi:hypothetical protein
MALRYQLAKALLHLGNESLCLLWNGEDSNPWSTRIQNLLIGVIDLLVPSLEELLKDASHCYEVFGLEVMTE